MLCVRRDDLVKVRHGRRFDVDLEVDVEDVVVGVAEVRQRRGDLGLCGAFERLECGHGDDPRRDGGAKVLAEERAERHILPLLNVARGPVVEQHHAEKVLLGLCGGDGSTHIVADADKHTDLELNVKKLAGPEDRRGGVLGQRLAARALDGCARDDDGRRAPVVADREMEPVLLEGVVFATEHCADVCGVVARRVEVRVVADLGGEAHGHEGLRHKERGLEHGVACNARIGSGEQRDERHACLRPSAGAERHELVQSSLAKAFDGDLGEQRAVE
eukprot:Amastigsp_a682245_60.p2 type:complete len:274 gc:universal Amastigsp_a682245_60:1014-193(-)